MADATYIQTGDRIDYTPSSALAAGDVVDLSDGLVGIATQPIAADALGALAIEGVFEFVKATGFAPEIGEVAYWDTATSSIKGTSNTNTITAGKFVAAAASGDVLCRVKINA